MLPMNHKPSCGNRATCHLLRVAIGLAIFSLPLALLAADTNTDAEPAVPKPSIKEPSAPPGGFTVKKDWRWVKGAVFVPTNCVNEAQQWDEYDPVINDRELHYASFYGINLVRVFFHYDIYLKDKEKLLKNLEDFLTRADKYGIKCEFVFFDDCHFQPDPKVLDPGYQYPAPRFGIHNSQWWQSPGNAVKKDIPAQESQLKAYVQDIVSAHKDDKRIAFWEIYNEPHHSAGTMFLLENGQKWIHETGTSIPMTSTGQNFTGGPYSDFETWHWYSPHPPKIKSGPESLNTECMCRERQTVSSVVAQTKDKWGFVLWELGIGRDNCRFPWSGSEKNPLKAEADKPFHGVVFADGHPWSEDDVKALMGDAAFAAAPAFNVTYYKDDKFTDLAKQSITPMIDFDLMDEEGYGSPDVFAGIPKDHFSVDWKGTVQPTATGTYTFFTDGDGSIQVFVDGQSLIDKTTPDRSEVSHTIDLTAGQPVPVEVKYVHATGPASLHFDWSGPNLAKTVVLPVHTP